MKPITTAPIIINPNAKLNCPPINAPIVPEINNTIIVHGSINFNMGV